MITNSMTEFETEDIPRCSATPAAAIVPASTVTSGSTTAEYVTREDLEQVAQCADIVRDSFLRPAERFLQVLRYYRKSQILSRVWRNALGGRRLRGTDVKPWRGAVTLREPIRADLATMARSRPPRSSEGVERLRDDLQQGVLTLLGDRRSLGQPIDWGANVTPRPGRLWRFQLHYHEYLLDIASSADGSDSATWNVVWRTIESWIAANPIAGADRHGDAWHPYCISRRLAVWLKLIAVQPPPADLLARVLANCAQQAEFLFHNVETDLGGNHLLENVHALVLAGSALATDCEQARGPASDAWLDRAESILRRELPRQLLPQGEHF